MVSSRNRPSRKYKLVDSASVGTPKKILNHTETVEFTIHNFRNRTEKTGESIVSPILKAHGYNWQIFVFPRGLIVSQPVNVCCSLMNAERVRHVFNVRWNQRHRIFQDTSSYVFDTHNVSLQRDVILDKYLGDDGSLVLAVDITIAKEDKRVWYPKKLQAQDLLVELYRNADSETSDVAFSVDRTIYRAHASILSLRCKHLYDLAKQVDKSNDDSNETIRIDGVETGIFKSILDFIYTMDTPEVGNQETAKDLLVASDRFQCVQLKLYIESVIVDKFLNAKNAAVMLVLADSHSCALLKEAAQNLFILDTDAVKGAGEDWLKVRESNRLIEELLEAVVFSKKAMDVTSLRERLQQANLELDGSREILVHRLQTHKN